MVFGGVPISQRKRFGAANQTRPRATSGWVSVLRLRVWVTSADQDWTFVCALNQAVSRASAAAALDCAKSRPKIAKAKHDARMAPRGSTAWLGSQRRKHFRTLTGRREVPVVVPTWARSERSGTIG